MILKTYTQVLTTGLAGTVQTLKAVRGIEPHLHVQFGSWMLVGIGDVLIVAGIADALDPVRGSPTSTMKPCATRSLAI